MKLELINEPLKVTESTIIADLEDTMLTIGKRSKIFPVIETRSYETIGYFIIGDIYLGADTIVNTKKGAVGEPIEKLSQEAFVKCEKIDLSNTKSDSVSDKDFRTIEIRAYRNFEKIHESDIIKHSDFRLNKKRFNWSSKVNEFDFFIYLFDPEEFILIKDKNSLIALSKDEKEVIVCDKMKNSYIEVSKNNGVNVSSANGKIIKTSSTGGIVINGKDLSEIISDAMTPFREMFRRKDF
ncbi:MAG: hypothetical protein FK730_02395 [Asgard group archaeon]|nr:hypothetical protein [Asgard group archaeon]